MTKKNSADDKAPDQPPQAEVQEIAETPTPDVEASPKVRMAAAAVEKAKEELHKAQEAYEEIREKAAGKLKAIREKSVGDLIDSGLELVKKHPGPGVLVAALVGFFLGRLFRR